MMSMVLYIVGGAAVLFGVFVAIRTVQVWPRARRPELGPVLLFQAATLVVMGAGVVVTGLLV